MGLNLLTQIEKFYFNPTEHLVLLNPALPLDLQKKLKDVVHQSQLNTPHVWLTTSGSTSQNERQLKLIALSREALIASALAVNQHLSVNQTDVWLNVLPTFHVGGLGVFFRAFVSKSKFVNLFSSEEKWSPHPFYNSLIENKITLTSLVPTQLYDLIDHKMKAPSTLRAVIIGGAKLEVGLYQQARELDWPVLPSFGMSELGSQIATAELSSLSNLPKSTKEKKDTFESAVHPTHPREPYAYLYPPLKILSHISLKKKNNGDGEAGLYQIKSPSLFSGYYEITGDLVSEWLSPMDTQGWFCLQDLIKIRGDYLEPLGRTDDLIKINGETVNLAFLREKLNQFLNEKKINCSFNGDWALYYKDDLRSGKQLVFFYEEQQNSVFHSSSGVTLIQSLLEELNQQLLPFERIKEISRVNKIPKTPLGKIQYSQLKSYIKS